MQPNVVTRSCPDGRLLAFGAAGSKLYLMKLAPTGATHVGARDIGSPSACKRPPCPPPNGSQPLSFLFAPAAPKSEVTTPICRSAYFCCAAAATNASKKVLNFFCSSACIGAIDGELSIMNRRSTLFFGDTLIVGNDTTLVGGVRSEEH